MAISQLFWLLDGVCRWDKFSMMDHTTSKSNSIINSHILTHDRSQPNALLEHVSVIIGNSFQSQWFAEVRHNRMANKGQKWRETPKENKHVYERFNEKMAQILCSKSNGLFVWNTCETNSYWSNKFLLFCIYWILYAHTTFLSHSNLFYMLSTSFSSPFSSLFPLLSSKSLALRSSVIDWTRTVHVYLVACISETIVEMDLDLVRGGVNKSVYAKPI